MVVDAIRLQKFMPFKGIDDEFTIEEDASFTAKQKLEFKAEEFTCLIFIHSSMDYSKFKLKLSALTLMIKAKLDFKINLAIPVERILMVLAVVKAL